MRGFIGGIAATLAAHIAIAALVWFFVVPQLDWAAYQKPGRLEQVLATNVLIRWVRGRAASRTNPLSATPDNLRAARTVYVEHCAACHGLDGSGRNRFEAVFYPPIARLTGDIQKLSDSEIYFIVANGIRYTAMPGFADAHSPDDIWRTVLWIRHLRDLTTDERASIVREMGGEKRHHEETMGHDAGVGRHAR